MKSLEVNFKIDIKDEHMIIEDRFFNHITIAHDEAYLLASWIKEYLRE